MADELLRSKHGFGAFEDVAAAIESGAVDEFDLLLTKDANGKARFGWVEKDGNPIFLDVADTSEVEASVEALEAEVANKASVEDVESKIAEVETKVSEVDAKIADAKEEVLATVDEKVEASVEAAVESAVEESFEKVDYEISNKPEGTLVNKHDKEIRVMCPADTEWVLQESGAGADANKYYIGFKAFAPSEDVVSFKEDTAEIIVDDTMYYFENNEFAGIDETGRKYSIVWLPVAVYADGVWAYYGANSTEEKYIGWYYSVEWYNADGKVVASDCIRVNLSNENCHAKIEPFYVNNMATNAVEKANAYTDEQIAALNSAYTIVEF